MSSRYFLTLVVPLIVIVLAIPMILQRVPRNHIYGFRTAYTMSSDEVWYRANKISGIALLAAAIVWLLLGFVLPRIMDSASANRLVNLLGVSGVLAACAVSAWLTYRR